MKKCNQCGKCCTKYANGGLSASVQEINQWDHNRPDIYEYVHKGKIWHDPITKAQLMHCPWLTKQANNIYTCAIYFDRPEDCRYYPSTIQEMIQDQCEMLEANDLRDVRNAQKRLNNIMADSHK